MSQEGKSVAIPDEIIIQNIYLIRSKKVMLERDLAELYDVKAIRLREQVNRNKERFPKNFTFQLTKKRLIVWYRKMRYLLKNMVRILISQIFGI